MKISNRFWVSKKELIPKSLEKKVSNQAVREMEEVLVKSMNRWFLSLPKLLLLKMMFYEK